MTDVRGRQLRIIGLTGGIASGKSTVAKMFEEQGLAVVDADRVARKLSEPGGLAFDAIVKRFGSADRAKLREIVFKDPTARQDLEAILHPLIRSESMRAIENAADRASTDTVIYEGALLVETGRYRDLDGLIVVEAAQGDRKMRLMLRDGIPAELAQRIIEAQTGDAERRAAATWVIENTGEPDELVARVTEIIGEIRKVVRLKR